MKDQAREVSDNPVVAQAILDTEEELDEKTSSVAWIWELSKPERPYLVVGLIGCVFVGAAFPLLGYFLGQMISVFFNPSVTDMREKAAFWAYMFILLAGSQMFGGFASQYSFGLITERLARRVREQSFLKMLQMEVAWFDLPEHTAGTLAQQLATDCVMIKALTGERAATSVSQVVTLTVALVLAFVQSWEMTLVMLGLFPVIGLAFGIQHAVVTKSTGQALEAINVAGSVVSQTLLNMRTINAFGLESISLSIFQKNLIEPLNQFVKKGMVTGAGMGFGQFVILSGAGLAYYVGGQLILVGRATFSSIISVILCIMFGAVGFGQFSADASDQQKSSSSSENSKTME